MRRVAYQMAWSIADRLSNYLGPLGCTFVGTSTVMKLCPPGTGESAATRVGGGSASIEVLDCLGKAEETVLFVTIP